MSFPTLTLLDSFKRVAEAPVSNGGKWSLINGCKLTGEIASEVYTADTSFASGEDGVYWNAKAFTNPGVAIVMPHPVASNERLIGLWACLASPTEATKSGYRVQAIRTEEGKYTVKVQKCAAGTFSTLAETANVEIKEAGSLGLTVEGGKVTAWKKLEASSAWTVVSASADSSFNSGFVGITAKGTGTTSATNFEAGNGKGSIFQPVLSVVGKLSQKFAIAVALKSGGENLIHNPSFAHDTNGGTAAGWANSNSWFINAGATNKVFVIPGYAQAASIFGLESYLQIKTTGGATLEGATTEENIPVEKGVPITVYVSLYEEISGQKVRLGLGDATVGSTTTEITQGTSGWKRHSITLTPTASGFARFAVSTTGAAEATTILITAATTSEPYFDGDTAGAEWTGTAGNSVSLREAKIATLAPKASLRALEVRKLIEATEAGGKWSETAAWVGGKVPTKFDDVVLGEASGNLTIEGEAFCRSLVTRNYAKTLTHKSGTLHIGSKTVNAEMSAWQWNSGKYIPEEAAVLRFVSTAGVAQSVVFGPQFYATLILETGSYHLESNLKAFKVEGAGNFTLGNAQIQTSVWKLAGEVEATASTIEVTPTVGSFTGNVAFNPNNHTYNNVILATTAANGAVIEGSGTYETLTLRSVESGLPFKFEASSLTTVLDTIESNGGEAVVIQVESSTPGIQWKLKKLSGKVRVVGWSVKDSAAEGVVFDDIDGINRGDNPGWEFNNATGFASVHLEPAMEPWTNHSLKIFNRAIGKMFDPLATVIENSTVVPADWLGKPFSEEEKATVLKHCIPDPGWGSIVNPRTFPSQYNPQYLGQFVGVILPPNLTNAEDLILISEEQGFSRGTTGSVFLATKRSLKPGAAAPIVVERTNTNFEKEAYYFLVIVKAIDIPNSIETTGTTEVGAKVKSIPSTLGMEVGDLILGAGISALTKIKEVNSNTEITLSANATEANSGVKIVDIDQVAQKALETNINLVKPAGLQWTFLPTFGVQWHEATGKWSDAAAKITWAEAATKTP